MTKARDKKFDAPRHFDAEKAREYDARIGKVIPGYGLLHALAQSLIGEETGGQGRVLIVGAGTGRETFDLCGAFPGLSITGVDPSADMLAVARGRIAGLDAAPDISLHQGVIEDLPPGTPFDAATLLLVMHFIADDGGKARLLGAIAKRLRPGGILLLADMYGEESTPGFQEQMAAWRRLQEDAGVEREKIEQGFRHVAKDVHLVSGKRLSELLADAGFAPPQPFFRALMFAGWVARKKDS